MSLYTPGANGMSEVNLGSDAGGFQYLSDVTSFDLAHTQPPTTTPEESIDATVGAGTPSIGSPSAGTATWNFRPDIASDAFRYVANQYRAGQNADFRVTLGEQRTVETASSSSVTVEIDASERELEVAGTATNDIANTFGSSDLQPAEPWRRGLVIVIADVAYHLGPWKTATTRHISRLGAVAGGIVTPDAVALADVAAGGDWVLYEYGYRITFAGRVLQGADVSAATGGLTSTMAVQLSGFQTETFRLS